MQMPVVGLSTERHLDEYGEHHLSVLGAEKKASQLAIAFEQAQAALRETLAARYQAERLLTRAEALSAQAELEVEDAIRAVESPLMLATKKQRQLDPYRAVFPLGLGGALGPRASAQLLEAGRILRTVQATAGASEAVGASAAGLEASMKTLEARIASEAAAETAFVTAQTAEQVQKRRWREQYRQNYGSLVALFPSDKRKVETFFKKPSKRERADSVPPPELVEVAAKK